MAVHKSSLVNNLEARTRNILGQKGLKKIQLDLITTTGAVADNDVIATNILIPVDSMITSVIFGSDDLGTTGDLGIGLHNADTPIADLTNSNAIDEDCIAAAIDVNAAAVVPTEYRFSAQGIETILEKAWETAGLSAKPSYSHFRLTLTASQATTAAGDMQVKLEYMN